MSGTQARMRENGWVWDDGEVSIHTRHKRGEEVVAGVMEEEMTTTLVRPKMAASHVSLFFF